MSLGGAADLANRATLTMGRILMLGAGCFGPILAEQLIFGLIILLMFTHSNL
jgi:hypothetical protein